MPTNGASWSRPEDLVGETLEGRYRVLRLMGVGGMGAVYEARHVRLDKRVAVKILSPVLAADERQRKRFLREARAATKIPNKHVVEILDFGEDPTTFFVMEFIDGVDLAAVIRAQGKLDWPRAQRMFLQILEALSAAHRAGIVHRDMKPSNVFVDVAPDGLENVTVLDFGIAKVSEHSLETQGITRTDEVIGTVPYMPPEQAMGGVIGPHTDIYASGIVLFQMLAGTVPFNGTNPLHVLYAHVHTPPPPVRQFAPETPEFVERCIFKALEKKPESRFSSMDEFAAALSQVPQPLISGPAGTSLFVDPLVEAAGGSHPSITRGQSGGMDGVHRTTNIPQPRTEALPPEYHSRSHPPATQPQPQPFPAGVQHPPASSAGYDTIIHAPTKSSKVRIAMVLFGATVALGAAIGLGTYLAGPAAKQDPVNVASIEAKPADRLPRSEVVEEPLEIPAHQPSATALEHPQPPQVEPTVEQQPQSATPPAEAEPATTRPAKRRHKKVAKKKTLSDDARVRRLREKTAKCAHATPVAVKFQIMPSGKPGLLNITPPNDCVERLVSATTFATRERPARKGFTLK